MKLFVTITEGKALPSGIDSTICSPYINIWVKGSTVGYQTSVAMDDSNPSFSESAMLDVDDKNLSTELALIIQLWQKNEDEEEDLLLSSVKIPINVENINDIQDSWFSLIPTKNVIRGGSINIQYSLIDSSSEDEIKQKYEEFCSETGSESQCKQFSRNNKENSDDIHSIQEYTKKNQFENNKITNQKEEDQCEDNSQIEDLKQANDTTPLLDSQKVNSTKQDNKKIFYMIGGISILLIAIFFIILGTK